MLPTKQIQVITTNTSQEVCPHCWLQTFAGFLQCWNYSCIKSWNYSEAPPCLWLQAAQTKPRRECWVLPLVKQGWKGAPAVLCLPTPCQGFALLPGSALQTPGLPAWAATTCQGCACSSFLSSHPHCSLSSFPCSHTTFERTKLRVGYLS